MANESVSPHNLHNFHVYALSYVMKHAANVIP